MRRKGNEGTGTTADSVSLRLPLSTKIVSESWQTLLD